MTDVVVAGGFLARYQSLNRTAIIPHCLASLERVGWLENLRAVVTRDPSQERRGPVFADSEVYKTLEALVWENRRAPDGQLERSIAALTDVVAQAQCADGYVSSAFGRPGGPGRYGDLANGNELYCLGHLIQAGVAALRADGPPALALVARRAADHVCRTFGAEGREGIDGHPEIETALVELYRATGEERYLEQATIFVERRGHGILGDSAFGGSEYYQDATPVRDGRVLVGHAVRALYLAAGAIDVGVETGDEDLVSAVRAQYDHALACRTYLTGGMGARHHGEAFGDDYELPSARAYSETCAAVASIHVAWRLLLATGDVRYADVIERTLYNAVVSSPSLDGTTFFYVNPLRRTALATAPAVGRPSLRRTDGRRASWFTTSCCPTNLARTFASLSGYLATVDDGGVQLHQYWTGSMNVQFGRSRRVRLELATGYPVDGAVVVRIRETDGAPWSLTLRVPEWAVSATLVCDGREAHPAPGPVTLRRPWRAGDEIEIRLAMPPRYVYADPRIDDLRGCAAVERGPLVYALESVDQPGVDLDRVAFNPDAPLLDGETPTGLDGVRAVSALGAMLDLERYGPAYSSSEPVPPSHRTELTLVPYYTWANRQPSTMRVWAPVERST